ncbi:MAG: glycosyltransferase family 4 protein [Anaerolineae bacterium]
MFPKAEGIPFTGATLYSQILIEEMRKRHDVHIGESPEESGGGWDLIHVPDALHYDERLVEKRRCPLIVDVHTYYWMKFEPFWCPDLPLRYLKHKLDRRRYEEAIRAADAVITHCEYVRERIAHPRTFNVGIGIYPERFAPPPGQTDGRVEATLILFVGTNYFRKGLYTLLRALPFVQREVPGVRLLVVGRERPHSLAFARLLSRGLPVSYINGLPFEQVAALYRRARVFTLPSFMEASPVTPLEAASAELPAVCSNVGGIPELVEHNVTGLLCAPGDHQALAESLIACLRDRKLAQRLAENAAARVRERFTVERMIENIEQVYLEVGG